MEDYKNDLDLAAERHSLLKEAIVGKALLGAGNIHSHPDSEQGRAQALAPVWARRWTGVDDQGDDALFWPCAGRKPGTDFCPQVLSQQVAVAWRFDRFCLPTPVYRLAVRPRLADA